VPDAWFDELAEFLRIPSVSADPAHGGDVRRAAEWARDFVVAAGGDAELLNWGGRPLVVGEFKASVGAESAPTALCYGHFDVQPPAPLEQWESDAFEPEIRGEWLYGRGVADDKGQLYMLLTAARELAREGALPLNVRFAMDGEEEIGGQSIVEFLAQDERGADVCVIFDAGMLERGKPTFNIATRGLAAFDIRVRTGTRDLHSGMYGNAGLNAIHALMQCLVALLPRDGRLREELRVGIEPPTEAELEDWRSLQPGPEVLAEAGVTPYDERAADEFYLRTWAEPSVEVNGIQAGKMIRNTTLVVFAEANFTVRLAPGQDYETVAKAVRQIVQEATPPGAEVELVQDDSANPGLVAPDSAAIHLGLDAFERALGVRPVLTRSGGTLPIMPALAEKGIPTILTGFALNESNVHSPNERLLVDYIPLGVAAARELFVELGKLPPSS
jgi:acetylornithine deacetylase/succinyl-diaminopimelate desuccinylase-like protein